MQVIKTLETRNHTYYLGYGCKTNYERTEEEKEERRYMIMQKSIGIILIILAALSTVLIRLLDKEFGIVTVICAFFGIILILSNKRAFVV